MNQTKKTVPPFRNTEPSNSETPEEFRDWLQDELRLAKAYWQQIQPFIIGRKLDYLEFEVASRAHSRVKETVANARQWNTGQWPLRGDEGKQFPIPAKEFPVREEFRKPEPLLADTSLKPETLAMIASPMVGKKVPKVAPSKSVHIAHALVIEAQDYLETLRKHQTKRAASLLFTRQIIVSFDEIETSNIKGSGQLPLLPPVQSERSGGQLKLSAIKAAISRFYETRTNLPPKELEAIKNDCLLNNRIPFPDLCALRWERFKNYWHGQQSRTQKRKLSQSTLPEKSETKANLLQSAASRPTVARKRKQ